MKKILLCIAIAGIGLSVKGYSQTIAITQNFEGVTIPALPTGWVNTTTGGGQGWVTNSGAVNWPISPLPAHSTYCFVNDYAHYANNPAYLTTPTFSLVGVTTPYLAFDDYFIQAYDGTGTYPHEQAWVEFSSDGGTTWLFADSILASGTSVPLPWKTTFLSLSVITGFAATATCQLRFCYTDQGGISGSSGIIGVAIDNVMVYAATANFIGLSDVTPVGGAVNDYFLVGSNASFGGTIKNYGSTTVTSITSNYQVASGTPVTATVSGLSIAPYSTGTFTNGTPYTVTTASQLPVTTWISGTGATQPSLDTQNTLVIGYGFSPTKKELFEEATGTWCGFCVRGIVFMDSLWKNDSSSVSIISAHDSDPMSEENTTTQHYDSWISSQISGYPSMVIDRRYTDDPQNALIDHSNDADIFGFANIALTVGQTYGGFVNVVAKVTPALNLTGSYQLQMVIEEEGVHGTATTPDAGYFQHDYYGINGSEHGSLELFGCGYNFDDTVVDASTQAMLNPSLYFPFVARYTVPDMNTSTNGVAGSLPATMVEGSVYTYSFAPVAIQTTTLAWIPNNLRVVVMLIDNNPANVTYGQVLNTQYQRTPYWYAASVANVNNVDIEDMTVFPNPASQEAHVKFGLTENSNIQVSVLDALGRVVYSQPSQQMSMGQQQIDFSTAGFASGVYNVVLNTDNGSQSQRLTVVNN